MVETSWDRRDLLGGAALMALVVGVPIGIARLSRTGDGGPTDRQKLVVAETAQIVIPRTATPGGRDVGAHDFVIAALANGQDGTRTPAASGAILDNMRRYYRPNRTLDHLSWLEDELDRRTRGDFLAAPLARRQAALGSLDAAAFAQGAAPSPWRPIKGLILTGYYTSEIGGSKELQYELVPGRFDPDIPYVAGTPAWSSDWTAVEFS